MFFSKKTHTHTFLVITCVVNTELQIREGTEDNSKIIFLISQ